MLEHKFKKEIAHEYGWDRKTLYNKLCRCGLFIGRGLVSPEQQKQIYNRLGYPPGIKEVDYKHLRDLSDAQN